jgi:hypothetical protein
MDATNPNVYNVLIILIQTLGTAFGLWLTYRATIRNVASRSQVDEVHKTVNGNLSRATEKAEKYARMLRANGIEPDDDAPAPEGSGSTPETL